VTHSQHQPSGIETEQNVKFRFFPQLNEVREKSWMHSHANINLSMTDCYFNADTLQDKFLRSLAEQKVLPIKEILECFEYFSRIRKQTKSACVIDLCCGHGLLGVLFAMFERRVEQVILVDKMEPPSRCKLLECAASVAPWISDKIENCKCKISVDSPWLVAGCSVVSAHACGTLSDLCIDIAIKCGGSLAILPCCYPRKACRAPLAIQTAFGLEQAFDIDRTYRLENNGYRVRWSAIPAEITPMNRVMIAVPKTV